MTGAGSGIGAAIALTLANSGAKVTICGRRFDALKSTMLRQCSSDAPPRGNIHAVAADVTDKSSIAQLYERGEKQFGKIDIVVANAGMAESAPAEQTSLELWNTTLQVNLTGAFLSVKPALAAMRERGWGRIIFIASTAGLKGYPYVSAYVAAKHGVIGLTRALALETAKAGITVNAVCPGYTATPLLENSVKQIVEKTGRSGDEVRARLAANNPQGRLIEPQEVADTVLWLCSESAASVSGQAISLSGGETW